MVFDGWWLVFGGWWLVFGGWWLAVGGWWLVVGGWWLVVGGWYLPIDIALEDCHLAITPASWVDTPIIISRMASAAEWVRAM